MSNWIEVGRVADIPVQGARVIKTADGNIAVFRTISGKIYALDDKCPHKNGPLSQGIVHGERVTCPLHNWVMELSDGNAVAPDVGCVQTYPIDVREDVIFIQLERKQKEKAA